MSSIASRCLLSRYANKRARAALSRFPTQASLWTAGSSLGSKSSGGAPTKGPSTTGPSSSAGNASKNVDPPAFVFKKVGSELGPGAGKDKEYKNPEYFSYHQLSYADMDIVMSKLRCPQPSSVANKS